jgi:hypothetical protein
MPRSALESWPEMSQVMVVGEDSEVCSKVTWPVIFESPRMTATGGENVSRGDYLGRRSVASTAGTGELRDSSAQLRCAMMLTNGRRRSLIDSSKQGEVRLTCFDHFARFGRCLYGELLVLQDRVKAFNGEREQEGEDFYGLDRKEVIEGLSGVKEGRLLIMMENSLEAAE